MDPSQQENENMVNQYPQVVTALALGTLDSQVALRVMAGYEGSAMQNKTLLKRWRVRGAVSGMVSGEGPLLIGLAWGGLSVLQIKTALELIFAPETGSAGSPAAQQATIKRIAWETLTLVHRVSATAFNVDMFDSGDRSLGGGKGFPFMENVGWQVFAYNLSGADLTGTPTLSISQEAWGVSLE